MPTEARCVLQNFEDSDEGQRQDVERLETELSVLLDAAGASRPAGAAHGTQALPAWQQRSCMHLSDQFVQRQAASMQSCTV